MRITGLGRLLFAAGFAATGVLTIVTRDVAFLWRPLAQGDAWHDTLAVLSGALVLAAAVGLLIPRTEQMASLALAAFLLCVSWCCNCRGCLCIRWSRLRGTA